MLQINCLPPKIKEWGLKIKEDNMIEKDLRHPNENKWIENSTKMKSVYISGPITADNIDVWNANIMRARKVYWYLVKHGLATYCPHTMSDRVGIRDERGVDHDMIMPNDLYWVTHCDIILMIGDYESSSGCLAELRLAKELKKRIYFSKEELIKNEVEKKEN